MAYYSNSGAAIHSGAAGLLQSYKDGSLGAMATMVDGGSQLSSGVRTVSLYSTYSRDKFGSNVPRKRLPANTPMWKILFRVDNGKYDSLRKINDAIRKQGGLMLSYKKGSYGTYYGEMYYPKNLFTNQFYDGVYVVIIGSTRVQNGLRGEAYDDGILGAVGAGPLKAYQDGSLGRDPGLLRAFQDGSLGHDPGLLQSYKDGSLGMSPGPLMSYQDGSLGFPLFLETPEGVRELDEPVVIRHGNIGEYYSAGVGEYFSGTAGVGEYFSGMAGCSSCGQSPSASVPVLNLSDPSVMKELKTAIAAAPWLLVNMQQAADQLQADLLDPKWTSFTTNLVEIWMQGYGPWMVQITQGNTQGASAEEYVKTAQQGFVPPEQIPNVLGVQAIYSVLSLIFLGEDGQGKNAMFTPSQFPLLTSFVSAVNANNGQGEVAFVGGGGPFQANMLTLGLGALAIAGLAYLALGKKKR